MSTPQSSDMQPSEQRPPDRPGPAGRFARYLRGHPTVLLLLALVPVLIAMQWSSIKVIYYRSWAGPTADSLAWQSDLPAALATARKSGKLVLIDFHASWCGPCQVMKHEAWPDARVQKQVADHFVPVSIDIDARESYDATLRYRVQAIPLVLIVDHEGRVLKSANFLNARSLLEFLNTSAPNSQSATPDAVSQVR